MQSSPKDEKKITAAGDDQISALDRRPLEYGLYWSAAFGGFLVGFGELIRAGSDTTNVTVLRISAVLREQFSPLLGAGWIALCMMAIFSTVLCTIYRPVSRKESFTLGLSVFAILSAFTPQQQARLKIDVTKSPLSFFSLISEVVASPLKTGELGDYYFEFTNQKDKFRDKNGLISIYDYSERYLLLTKPMDSTKISKLRLPKGSYILKFECGGCASSRVELYVEKPAEASMIKLSDSKVPLSFQRLFNAEVVQITDLPDTELDRIQKAYAVQQQQ